MIHVWKEHNSRESAKITWKLSQNDDYDNVVVGNETKDNEHLTKNKKENQSTFILQSILQTTQFKRMTINNNNKIYIVYIFQWFLSQTDLNWISIIIIQGKNHSVCCTGILSKGLHIYICIWIGNFLSNQQQWGTNYVWAHDYLSFYDNRYALTSSQLPRFSIYSFSIFEYVFRYSNIMRT